MKKKGEEEKLDLKPPTPLSLQYPTYTSKYINTYTFIRLRYRDSPYDIDMTINLHTFVPILKGMQVNQQRFLKEGGGGERVNTHQLVPLLYAKAGGLKAGNNRVYQET